MVSAIGSLPLVPASFRCGIAPRRIPRCAKMSYTCARQAGIFPSDVQEGKAMLKRLRFSLTFRKTAKGWQFHFAVEYLI